MAYRARGHAGITRRDLLVSLGASSLFAGAAERVPLPALRDRGWRAMRRVFLLRQGLAYLNSATLGACPVHVLDATLDAWRRLEGDPADEGYGPFLERMESVRVQAAAFLGCTPNEVALTRSTTDAMNTIAQGLGLRRGDRVLTTGHEHPGGRVCWDYYAARDGVAVDVVRLPVPPANPEEVVALFGAAVRPTTRVISVSHVTFTTGLRLPIRQLAQLAEAHGALLVVDGAQGPGALQVDVRALGCHAYATSAHKWMLAPKGTGLLYVASSAQTQVTPLLLHQGYGVYTAATGTRDFPAVLGLGTAIAFLTAVGRERIEERTLALRRIAWAALSGVPGVRLLSPPEGAMASPILAFGLPAGTDPAGVAAALRARHRVIVKLLPPEPTPGLRVSFHLYNSEEDIERLSRALRTELRSA